jgi:hypothetical protein
MKIDEHYQYLLQIFGDKIPNRFSTYLRQMQDVINKCCIGDAVRIDEDLLALAILDYFEDIARLKDFQDISYINEQKIYSYGTYWLLRRKPVQLTRQVDDKYIHINEKVVLAMMLPKMFEEKGIQYQENHCTEAKQALFCFSELLLYNFKFRTYTQQSLELMVEAFFCGCQFSIAKEAINEFARN